MIDMTIEQIEQAAGNANARTTLSYEETFMVPNGQGGWRMKRGMRKALMSRDGNGSRRVNIAALEGIRTKSLIATESTGLVD